MEVLGSKDVPDMRSYAFAGSCAFSSAIFFPHQVETLAGVPEPGPAFGSPQRRLVVQQLLRHLSRPSDVAQTGDPLEPAYDMPGTSSADQANSQAIDNLEESLMPGGAQGKQQLASVTALTTPVA